MFSLFHKLSGEPVDFPTIAAFDERVRRAPQFDKAAVQAAEEERLRSAYDAVDTDGTFWIRVGSRLQYDLEQERFRIELFEPGRFLIFRPVASTDTRAQTYHRRIVFANGAELLHLPLPRDQAAQIDEVRRLGSTGCTAEIEMVPVGTGDPTGAVDSANTLRMAVRSIRFHPPNARVGDSWPIGEPITLRPYDKSTEPKPRHASGFDIVGLRTGVNIRVLQRTIEKEFGPVSAIGRANNDDPRLVSGVGHDVNGCYSFGNTVARVGNVCIRAFADEGGTVRKIIVEQILEGAEWEPMRLALLDKYGAMSQSVRRGNVQYFAWGPEVAATTTADDRSAPSQALTASLSAIQSAMDRASASTRVSTNLRIRLIDPDWAGSPAATPATPAAEDRPATRVPRL